MEKIDYKKEYEKALDIIYYLTNQGVYIQSVKEFPNDKVKKLDIILKEANTKIKEVLEEEELVEYTNYNVNEDNTLVGECKIFPKIKEVKFKINNMVFYRANGTALKISEFIELYNKIGMLFGRSRFYNYFKIPNTKDPWMFIRVK